MSMGRLLESVCLFLLFPKAFLPIISSGVQMEFKHEKRGAALLTLISMYLASTLGAGLGITCGMAPAGARWR